MTAPAWTPGPWRAEIDETTGAFGITTDDGWLCSRIATGRTAASVANARLIAAAPELYEALNAILPLAEAYLRSAPTHPDNGKLADARDALAKARGES